MKIKASECSLIYKRIWKKVYDQTYNGSPVLGARGDYSKLLWNKKMNGKYIAIALFAGKSNISWDYLHRRYLDRNSREDRLVSFYGEVLLNVLNHLGFKPNAEETRIASEEKRAEKVHERFCKINAKEILEEENSLNDETSESTNVKYLAKYNEKNLQDASRVHQVGIEGIESLTVEAVKNLVNQTPEGAWNLFTPAFKKRAFDDRFELFERSRTNIPSVRNIHVFDKRIVTETYVTIKVYYEAKTLMFKSSDLDFIKSSTVADINELVNSILKIKDRIHQNKGVDFELMPIRKFFDICGAERMWIKCGIERKDVHRIFPIEKYEFIPRLYTCDFQLIEGQWLIESIRIINAEAET